MFLRYLILSLLLFTIIIYKKSEIKMSISTFDVKYHTNYISQVSKKYLGSDLYLYWITPFLNKDDISLQNWLTWVLEWYIFMCQK